MKTQIESFKPTMKAKLRCLMSGILLLSVTGCACQKVHVSDLPPLPKPQAPKQIMQSNQYDFLQQLRTVFSTSQEKQTKQENN